jgi:hypothetical protein
MTIIATSRNITSALNAAYPYMSFRRTLLSIANLNSCSVISSGSSGSMEQFISKCRKKETVLFQDVPGAVCVWGPYGCGKTTWVRENFDVVDQVEQFSALPPHRWILIDNCDDPDQYQSLFTRPRTLFISTKPIDELHCYEFPNKTPIRTLFGQPDIFKESRDVIIENLQSNLTTYTDMFHTCSGEHGNGMGLVHENFIHADASIGEMADVLDSLAWSDMVDYEMYRGKWDMFHLFNFFAYVTPCSIIRGRVAVGSVSPATMWTKYLNGCMKEKRLAELRRISDLCIGRIDVIYTLGLLRDYAVSGLCMPLQLSGTELDVLKYVDFYGKLKPRMISKLKKAAFASV